MKALKSILLRTLLPPIGFALIFLFSCTFRPVSLHRERESKLLDQGIHPVYTFWHGRIFYFPFLYRWQWKHQILVSPSPDGEVIGKVLRLFGFSVIWGSTFKQGSKALLSLVRKIRKGSPVVLIADGSRGPHHKVQMGTVSISRITGAPIIPIAWGAENSWVFRSWDRFTIPKPFTRVAVSYGVPITVPRRGDEILLESKRAEVERELLRITEEVDHYFSLPGK